MKKTALALALGTALSVTMVACGDSGDTTTPTVADTPAATNVVTTASPATQATQPSPATSASPDRAENPASTTGDDPVFAAIEAVLAAHPGGIITDIDREDDRPAYDIDVVTGDIVLELEVDEDGTIREDDRDDDDDDDIAEARAATVTAAEAIRSALDMHEGGVLDEAELDEDDGALTWEIELDDANGNDLATVDIPAR